MGVRDNAEYSVDAHLQEFINAYGYTASALELVAADLGQISAVVCSFVSAGTAGKVAAVVGVVRVRDELEHGRGVEAGADLSGADGAGRVPGDLEGEGGLGEGGDVVQGRVEGLHRCECEGRRRRCEQLPNRGNAAPRGRQSATMLTLFPQQRPRPSFCRVLSAPPMGRLSPLV